MLVNRHFTLRAKGEKERKTRRVHILRADKDKFSHKLIAIGIGMKQHTITCEDKYEKFILLLPEPMPTQKQGKMGTQSHIRPKRYAIIKFLIFLVRFLEKRFPSFLARFFFCASLYTWLAAVWNNFTRALASQWIGSHQGSSAVNINNAGFSIWIEQRSDEYRSFLFENQMLR